MENSAVNHDDHFENVLLLGNQGTRMSDEFEDYLNQEEFNFLRGNERFLRLIQ